MKILDILSMIHRICNLHSRAFVKLIYVALLIVLVVFFCTRCSFPSSSSSRLTPEEIYLRGAEDISRDFDEQFNRVFGTYGDSLHLYGFRIWKHSNMIERLSR